MSAGHAEQGGRPLCLSNTPSALILQARSASRMSASRWSLDRRYGILGNTGGSRLTTGPSGWVVAPVNLSPAV